MVPARSDKVSRVSSYSDPARRLGISDTRLSLSPAGLPSPFSYLTSATTQSEPRDARITVWALSISLAATLEIDKFSFSSSGYLDVSVPRVPHVQLCIHCTLTEVSSAGFPHSDISGSLDMCSSPKLFAAYHVFHRLLVPRHASTLRPYYFNRSRNDRIS